MLPKLFTQNNKINPQIQLKAFQNSQTTIINPQKLPPLQLTQKYQTNPPHVKCQICYKQYLVQNMIKVCKNQHIFCHKCVRQHIKIRMQGNQRLVCCMVDCQEDIISKIDVQQQKQMQQQAEKRTNTEKIISMKNTSLRQTDNQDYTNKANNSSTQKIKQYKKSYKKLQQRCKNCKYAKQSAQNQSQDHKFNIKNSKTNIKLLQKCQSCKALQQSLPQTCKICPNCSKPIQKQKGCDHVKCVCQFQFCFICTQQWSRNHFCKSRIPVRQGISYYIFFVIKIFVTIVIFIPLFIIFLLLTLTICILTSFLFGSYLYIRFLQKISKKNCINDCIKIIVCMLSLILFPAIVITCIMPGFFVPFVNMCLKQEDRIMYRTDFVYQLGESLFGCIMIVKLI